MNTKTRQNPLQRKHIIGNSIVEETSQQAYSRLAEEVAAKMAALNKHLQQHAVSQKQDPTNWGFVGDMAAISRRLGELLGEEE